MLEMPCGNFSVGSIAPENICSARTSNGPAGILIHSESAKGLPALDLSGTIDNRFFGLDETMNKEGESWTH